MKEDFNFIEQVKGNYDKILPKKEYGMIIFLLHDKFEEKVFSEEELKRTISNFHNYHEKEREQHARIKSTIQFLSQNFIIKSKQGYRLKPYAIQFTRQTIKKLNIDFSPSRVERILLKLKNELIEKLNNENNTLDNNDFNEWIETFERYKTDLDLQIEGLEKKIEIDIGKFRVLMFENKTQDVRLLKSIRDSVQKIKEQVAKLMEAFRYIDDIEYTINGVIITGREEETSQNKGKIINYFRNTKEYLEFVSNRINLVQPRINEFFTDLSRADFDKKTKSFIRFLIKNTTRKKDRAKKVLEFPCENIFTKRVYKEKFVFTITDKPLKKGKGKTIIHSIEINEEELNKQFKKVQKNREKRNEIKKYVSEIKKDLEKNTMIEYAPYFYKIIKETQNINIAIKVAYVLLNEYAKLASYFIEIENIAITNQTNPNMALWQMKIRKKNQKNYQSTTF